MSQRLAGCTCSSVPNVSGGLTSTLPTCRARGWTGVSWFARGCGWGRGYVCTSHTGCRTDTRWQRTWDTRMTWGTQKLNASVHFSCKQGTNSGSKSEHQPALVGAVRGEFVAAAAVRSVAEGAVGGGRTRQGAHDSAGSAAGFKVPVRRFVSATLAGEVAAHPLHYLFHHLIFKLEKILIRLNVNRNPERTIPRETVKVHLFHVRSEPHGRRLVFGFATLGVLDRNLRRNTSEFSQICKLLSSSADPPSLKHLERFKKRKPSQWQ